MKVDFFVAGVQKGGTTALDSFLRRHHRVQMAHVKELHVFDDESVDWSSPNFDRLHAGYDWLVADALRGEATPIYTYWPPALERLKRYNPEAKLIVGLRHPSYRAFSHWRMETSRGAETLPFSEAIRAGRARVAAAPNGVHRVYSYVERGFYSAQVARLRIFDPDHVHYFRTDRLWIQPRATLDDIQRFLGIEPINLAEQEYLVPVTPMDLGAPSDADLAYLNNLFASDVRSTAEATGLDLEDWFDLNYREPMPSPGMG